MFYGSLVALVTPFRDGKIDELALRTMVDHQVDHGTEGLVPVGTTGESSTLTADEHRRVVKIVIEQNAGRAKVLAGAGSNDPMQSIAHARYAERVGADGVLVVAGYYNRPSQDGIYEHYKMLHDEANIPIVIYNIPSRTVVDISVQTMARLAQLPRVVGVKDARGDMGKIAEERIHIDDDFCYLSGDDISALAYLVNGGQGCISVTGNVAPELCTQMQTAARTGDFSGAKKIHDKLVPLHLALFREPSPAGVKYAASLLGLCQEEARVPIMPISQTTRAEIERAMHQVGVL